jgi:hypothetical protein
MPAFAGMTTFVMPGFMTGIHVLSLPSGEGQVRL